MALSIHRDSSSFKSFSLPAFPDIEPCSDEGVSQKPEYEDSFTEEGESWKRFVAEAALNHRQMDPQPSGGAVAVLIHKEELSCPSLAGQSAFHPSDDPPVGMEDSCEKSLALLRQGTVYPNSPPSLEGFLALPQKEKRVVPKISSNHPGLKRQVSSHLDAAQIRLLISSSAYKLCDSWSNPFFRNATKVLSSIPPDEISHCMKCVSSLYPLCEYYRADVDVEGRIYLLEEISKVPFRDRDHCVDRLRSVIMSDQTGFFWQPKNSVKLLWQLVEKNPGQRSLFIENLKEFLSRCVGELSPSQILEKFNTINLLGQQINDLNSPEHQKIDLHSLIQPNWKLEQIEQLQHSIEKLPAHEVHSIVKQALVLRGSSRFVSDTLNVLRALRKMKEAVRERCVACLELIDHPDWSTQGRLRLLNCMTKWQIPDLRNCMTALSAVMRNDNCRLNDEKDVLVFLEQILMIYSPQKNGSLNRVRCIQDLGSVIAQSSFFWKGKQVLRVFGIMGSIESCAYRPVHIPRQGDLWHDVMEDYKHAGAHVRLLLLAMRKESQISRWSAERIILFLESIHVISERVLDCEGSALLRRLYKIHDWKAKDTVQFFTQVISQVDHRKLAYCIRDILKHLDNMAASDVPLNKDNLIKTLASQ